MPDLLTKLAFLIRALRDRVGNSVSCTVSSTKFGNSVQFGAMNAQLFAFFSARSVLDRNCNRTFNAVVAGSSPARLTIIAAPEAAPESVEIPAIIRAHCCRVSAGTRHLH